MLEEFFKKAKKTNKNINIDNKIGRNNVDLKVKYVK